MTEAAVVPPGRSSRRKLAFLFTVPTLIVLVLFGIAMATASWKGRRMQSSQAEMTATIAAANTAMTAEQNRLYEQLKSGELTQPEHLKSMSAEQQRYAGKVQAAQLKWTNSMAPLWVQIFVAITLAATLPLLLLIVIARIILGIFGGRLGDELRRKGYDWLAPADAMWLLVALRTEARRIPPAADFATLPDSRETVDSLVAFTRMRRSHRAP